MRYSASILILLAGVANADVWKCQDGYYWQADGKVLVTATVNRKNATASVIVAGVTHDAYYQVKGFNRRWDFGLNSNLTYDFAFVIKPDGMASYYNFSSAETGENISPSQFFACNQTS